jgi:hypothetical protein
MNSIKQRGRPKKNPEERVNWKYMAVYRETYEIFLAKSKKHNMTLVDYMKLLAEVNL